MRKHCFLPMFRHVSQSGQTLGNISEKHRETSNVSSEFARKNVCFSGSKFCFRNNVSTGGQTGKHLRKHRESQMFSQQCFLVCSELNTSETIYLFIVMLHATTRNLNYFTNQQMLHILKLNLHCELSLKSIPTRLLIC